MLNYFAHLWFWLLASLAVGVAAGALTRLAPRNLPRSDSIFSPRLPKWPFAPLARWLIWAALAFVAGLIVAVTGALQGVAGAHLESALGCFAAFMVGAAGGAWAEHRSLHWHEGWAIGLLPAALIWLAATQIGEPAFERELGRRVSTIAQRFSAESSSVKIAGRDIHLPPGLAANAQLVDALAATKGARWVLSDKGGKDKDESRKSAKETASITPPPSSVTGSVEKKPTTTTAVADAPASTDMPVSQTAGAETLSLAACETALNAERVEFCEASTAIYRRAARALDTIAATIRRCPADLTIEVVGRADNVGDARDNEELSQRRAEAVARYLRREGLSGRRIVAAGYGASRPIASNDDEDGRARNRSVSFAVKPTM